MLEMDLVLVLVWIFDLESYNFNLPAFSSLSTIANDILMLLLWWPLMLGNEIREARVRVLGLPRAANPCLACLRSSRATQHHRHLIP